MVLPGVRTDPRTPGGMPDSGTVNPGGPMPGMPKMGPGPGPTAPGVPDPAKIEEIFDQYTSGQITRQDLITQLSAFSEGQGGILGLLEGMQEQPDQGMQGGMPTMPGMQPGQPPQPGVLPGSPQGPGAGGDPMIAPGAAQTPIPPLHEPLDARHQQISQMLQGYGLGPADADQMSTLLNPQSKTATTGLVWSEEEKLWTDPSGGIGYDPSQAGTEDAGSQAAEFRLQAGMGKEVGSAAAGYVGGELYGDKSLLKDVDKSTLASLAAASKTMPGVQYAKTKEHDAEAQAALLAAEVHSQRQREAAQQEQDETLETGGRELRKDSSGQWWYGDQKVQRDEPKKEVIPDLSGGVLGSGLHQTISDRDTQSLGGETQEEMDKRLDAEREQRLLEERERAIGPEGIGDFMTDEGVPVPKGAAFHSFFGGTFKEADYTETSGFSASEWEDARKEGLARPRHTGTEAGLIYGGRPVWSDQFQGLFPNQEKLDEYVEWTVNPDNQIYGAPGITPEFDHWEIQKDGVTMTGIKDPQAWKARGGGGDLVGIPKHTTRVVVNVKDERGEIKPITYHMNTYGMTETAIATLRSNMINNFWVPYGADGDPAGAHYQEGYGLNEFRRGEIKAEVPFDLAKQLAPGPKDYKVGDELPKGWSFVEELDPMGEAEGGSITKLYDADGNLVGQTNQFDGTVTSAGEPPGGVGHRDTTGDRASPGYTGPRGTTTDTPGPTDGGIVAGQLTPEQQAAALSAGLDGPKTPFMSETELASSDYPIFQKFVRNLEAGALTSETFMTQIAEVIGDLEQMTAKGEQADAKRMSDTVANEILAKAAVTKEELDRDLKADAAIGEIAGKATLAASMEDAANAFKAAAAAGVIPVWQAGTAAVGDTPGTPGKWAVPGAPGVGEDPLPESIEGRGLTISEVDKERQRELDFSTVFGQYINLAKLEGQAGKSLDETMETLEKQKFGLTKALAQAEQTGIFEISGADTQADLISSTNPSDQNWLKRFFTDNNPENIHPQYMRQQLSPQGRRVADQIQSGIDAGTGVTGMQTLAAKRLAFEIDMGNRAADTADRLASIQEENSLNQTQVAQNRINIDSNIASGLLKEAVAARQDATWLATEGLRIQREKMKLDTLQSLQDPAAYLFAVRYGLLDQIGNVLGIDWGDDIISSDQLPTMVAPGTFPSRQEFEGATQMDQRIMLAELASSQGFSVDQAALMILGGSPGGRQIKRPSILGAAR